MEASPMRVEDLYRLVLVSSPEASPDGSTVAYVATRPRREGYDSSIWVATVDGYRPLTGGPRDLCPRWGPGGLLSFVRISEKNGEKRWSLMVMQAGGGEPWRLLDSRHPIGWVEWSPTGDRLVVVGRRPRGEWRPYGDRDALVIDRLPAWFNGEGWVYDRPSRVIIVDYPSGEETLVSPGNVDSWGARWSPDGRLLAYVRAPRDLEPYRHEVVVYDAEAGEERVIVEGLTVSGLAWSPDATMIAVRGHKRERGPASHHKIMVFNLEGEMVDCLTCDLDRNTLSTVNSDVRGPSCNVNLEWGRDGRVYFLVHDAGRVHLYAGRPGGGEVEELVHAEAGVVDEFTISPTDPPVIYYTFMRPTEPKEVYLLGDEGPTRLTGHNDALLSRRTLAEPRMFKVETRYGGKIDVWILPPARDPECEACVPWVLYIHGGPKTSYGYAFIHEFHVLSGAGFAVVYSNPHGSDGYSEEFADITGAWGTIDYEDLVTVAETAPGLEPSLDPARAAVAGGSYGGWMTAYITTRTRMFRAAVAQRGCVDWPSFYGASDIGWWFTPQQIGGHPWENPRAYISKSPLFSADNIETPTLIIHSTDDYRCPLDQALTHYSMLRVRGVEARLVVFPGENHDLSRTGTPRRRVRRIKEILEWLQKHLTGGGQEA